MDGGRALKRRVAVVGAGPAGAFVAGSLVERGFEVHLFDKQVEPWEASGEGRIVALSLSPRGFAALETVGLRGEVEAASPELVGRAFRAPGGGLRVFEAPEGAVRNRSVARAELTRIRCARALARGDVVARFVEPCLEVLRSDRAVATPLQGVVARARALLRFRPEPLAPELRASCEARSVPVLSEFAMASRSLAESHRLEGGLDP
jgi:2-polyprenyl-6-methoxyphenol hydroxylase-like FAD-dependent oxidoreductase